MNPNKQMYFNREKSILFSISENVYLLLSTAGLSFLTSLIISNAFKK